MNCGTFIAIQNEETGVVTVWNKNEPIPKGWVAVKAKWPHEYDKEITEVYEKRS